MISTSRRHFLKTMAGSTLAPFLSPLMGCSTQKSQIRPNILIYLADDQYMSSVGCYGANPSHTPNVDRLARQGMRFTSCFTPSAICTPNRGSLLSGMYPLKNGAHANHSGFNNGIKSLPNYMKELDYRACIVGKDGIQRPSDLYDWEFRVKKSEDHVPGADEPKHDRHRKTNFDEVEQFLASDDPRPFCLFHAASLPHSPSLNELPNGLSGYDASNWYMDYEFGKYLELLKKHGAEENTVVIYANDNEAQLARTKFLLYDTGLNVPFIVSWPGFIEPGSTHDAMISFIDIVPTLIDLAGGAIPESVDGKSMLELWSGKTEYIRDEIFASLTGVIVGSQRQEKPFPIRAVRTRKYKYIRYFNHGIEHPKRGRRFPAEELFDLINDPGELHNLAASSIHQSIKRELKQKMTVWMKEMNDLGIESEMNALKQFAAKN